MHLAARLGEQMQQLELAPRQVDGLPADEGLELVRADLELAGDDRSLLVAAGGALAAPHDGLDARDDLFRVARLRDPVVGAEPQAAHALGDGRLLRADDDAEPGDSFGQPLEELPRARAEKGQVDHDGVQPHGDEVLGRDGSRERAELPAGALMRFVMTRTKPAVGVDHGQAYRIPEGRISAPRSDSGRRSLPQCRAQSRTRFHRFFTRGSRPDNRTFAICRQARTAMESARMKH